MFEIFYTSLGMFISINRFLKYTMWIFRNIDRIIWLGKWILKTKFKNENIKVYLCKILCNIRVVIKMILVAVSLSCKTGLYLVAEKLVLVWQGYKLGSLNSRNVIFSKLWRSEIHDQGASRVCCFCVSPWLVDSHFSLCLHMGDISVS